LTGQTHARPRRLDRREAAAWQGFLRAHAEITRRLDNDLREQHDLTLMEYEVLLLLATAGAPLRPGELVERTILTPGGITRLVDRLAERGLVRRVPCPSDARGVFVEATPAGDELFRTAGRLHLAGIRDLFLSRLKPEHLDLLADVWEQVLGPAASGGSGNEARS
jgi:DNA-binding MarR family transcriptional regulator